MFTKLRQLLETQKEILQKLEEIQQKDIEQDQQILVILEYLRQLEHSRQEEEEFRDRKQIGFRQAE